MSLPGHHTSGCHYHVLQRKCIKQYSELLSVPEMIMGLPLRCRYLSVLQVVAIVVCYRGKASSVMVQGCVKSQLSVRCEEMKIINITAVVLGDYNGIRTGCNIKDDDCTRNANADHIMDVHRRCDGQSNCTVGVIKETISCGITPSKSDFERITYDCIDDPRRTTVSVSSPPDATETTLYTRKYSPENERTNGDTLNSTADDKSTEVTSDSEPDDSSDDKTTKKTDNSEALPVVMVIMGLIILLAIVVLVVVMYRRKKRAQVKLFDPVAMTQMDNRQNGSDIYANETQGTSLHIYSVPLSLSSADEADVPKTDEHSIIYSEVEQRQTVWTEGQSDRVTTDKSKAAVEAHKEGPDVYAIVNKRSKTSATSSAIKTDHDGMKGLVNKDDCFPHQIYSLASNDMEGIYVNETAVHESTQLVAGAISKTPSPQDDEDLSVIENDLYCH